MKTTKGKTHWAALVSYMLIYVVTAWLAPVSLSLIGPSIIVAIAASTGIFQAINAADNALKGHFYRPELDKEGK
jgi:hypothetical protein